MPDETYRIIYEGVPDKAIKGINALVAALAKLDTQVAKSKAGLRSLGMDTAGLTKFMSGQAKLAAALKGLDADAGKAEKALKDVGKGNNSLGGYATRLEKVVAELNAAAAAAGAAGTAMAGVGRGGAGGGGGGKGAGGVRGTARRVVEGGLMGLAYQAFRSTLGMPGELAEERREYYGNAANEASDYRASLQSLAVLQGKTSADDDMVRENLAFARAANSSPQNATEHRLEYGGAIGTVPPENLGAGVREGLELESARFGARYSMDPMTSGRLAGLIGNFQKIPTVAEGVGTMAEGAEIANVYGVGQVKDIMKAGLQLTGEMLAEEGGRFGSFKGLMARLSATTKDEGGSAPRAATRVRQSNRLLRKLAGDRESELGIKAQIDPEDDYETALKKLAPHITGANGDRDLKASGYRNDTEIKATINEAKSIALVDRIMADPKMAASRANAMASNRAYAGSDAGRQQAAENDKFAATVMVGVDGMPLKSARTAAEARLMTSGTYKPRNVGEQILNKFRSLLGSGGGVSGEDLNVDREAVAGLRREAKKYNVDIDRKYPGLADGVGAGAYEGQFQTQFAAASREVDAARHAREAAASLNRLGSALEKGGKPAPPPPGNGGAGVNPGRR